MEQKYEFANNVVERNPFLDDVFSVEQPIGITFNCTKNNNLGRPTFTTGLNMFQIFQHTDVSNDRMAPEEQSQRPLDLAHARGLALYILKGLVESAIIYKRRKGEPVNEKFGEIMAELGTQPYYTIPPMVANVRSLRVEDIRPLHDANHRVVGYQITLRNGDVLWIIDGQHRRKAIELVYDFLSDVTSFHKYPKPSLYPTKSKEKISADEIAVWNACKEVSKWCEIQVECHIALDIEQERQVFHDLNNRGKKVDKSLSLKFDNSNPINSYSSTELEPHIFDPRGFSVIEKDEVDWEEVKPSISRKQLVGVNAVLFRNKNNINGALPTEVTEYKKQIANQFWHQILDIPAILEEKHKLKTTAAQPVVLKALAKLYFDFFFGKNDELRTEENQQKLIDGINDFDFSHTNPAWRYYILKPEERALHGLEALSVYLPKDDEGKIRDLGAFDEKSQTFRFPRTHNDVYPLIGDILRWHCKLPSRNK
ncbi:DNA sulfur modification protein DndB [Flaviaesturariibacter aridisoli]|uniref:DGQHR domain-containing protein n=1 Tax=Flaviaesturariibacter aridisoli TaxID=2545761 RepID=A0A4R4DVF6_9BACT|nr:DNA sulfur modification protein DndB [Flaviaesturariibacter aridisoli]TCZ66430.1 hypothetical protein E0486_16745 [Flaviaesturariibacter aridisoli]